MNKCVLCIMKYNVQQKQQRKKNWSPVEEIHFPACIHYILFLGGTSASTQSSYNRKYLQLSELGQCTHLMLFQDLATVLCADSIAVCSLRCQVLLPQGSTFSFGFSLYPQMLPLAD